MLRTSLIGLFLLFYIPLFSLDIWHQNQLIQHFTLEEFQGFTQGETNGAILADIVPLFESVHSLEIRGNQGYLQIPAPQSLNTYQLELHSSGLIFRGPGIEIQDCQSIYIHGERAPRENIHIWLPQDWNFLQEDLQLYSQLKDVQITITFKAGHGYPEFFFRESPVNSLPGMVFFSLEDLPYIEPYLNVWPSGGDQAALVLTRYHAEDQYLMLGWDEGEISELRFQDIYVFLQPMGSRELYQFAHHDSVILHGEGPLPSSIFRDWYSLEYALQWEELLPWIEGEWLSHHEAMEKMEELGFYEHP